jgi:hypothetical protein
LRCLPALAAGAFWLACASAAVAADAASPSAPKPTAKPREGSLGKGGGTGAVLTREQLRQCLVEQDRLKQEGADLLQTQRTLDKERAEIDRLGVELKAEMDTLDRTSQAALDAFNGRVREREARVDAYRAASPPFNERVDKLESDKGAFAKGCADRRYREDDFDAIKGGK